MPMAGAVSAAVVGVRSDLAQAIWHPSEAFLAGPDLLGARKTRTEQRLDLR